MKQNKSNNTKTLKSTRRSFLKKSAAFGFVVMPSYLALGKADSEGNLPPSQRINLACIGIGGRATGVIPALCSGGGAKPVAFCDVDFKSRNVGRNLKTFPGVRRFADFRVMFDKMEKDIDAVSVVTPDHTHFVAAIDAMRRGKHVYVEKPLTHNFAEAEMLMKAEKKYGVVTQMGNQGHTSMGSVQFKKMVDEKVITDIIKIEAWKTASLWFMKANERISSYPKAEPMPKTLNWDLWCGPKEVKPFSKLYHTFNWRAFYLYGNGMLGDWGAHILDMAHDYLKLGLPTKIRSINMEDHNKVIFPLASKLAMHFPARGKGLPACDVTWSDGGNCVPKIAKKYWNTNKKSKKTAPGLGGAGTVMHRKDDKFMINRGSHAATTSLMPYETAREYRDAMKAKGPKWNHQQSFVQACMGNDTTRSPFSVGGALTQMLNLGVICQYLNTDLEFDPATKTFKNNDKANELLKGPGSRKGWEGFYKI